MQDTFYRAKCLNAQTEKESNWAIEKDSKSRMREDSNLADAEKFEIADAGGKEGEYSLFSSRTHLITLKLRGGKGVRGWERDEGLARCGDRWPSGARPSQPQPDGPGSRARAAEWRSGNRGAAETPRREERSRR